MEKFLDKDIVENLKTLGQRSKAASCELWTAVKKEQEKIIGAFDQYQQFLEPGHPINKRYYFVSIHEVDDETITIEVEFRDREQKLIQFITECQLIS